MRRHRPTGARALALLSSLAAVTRAVTPSGDMEISAGPGSTYIAPAAFGPYLPDQTHALRVELRQPDGFKDGCNPTVHKHPPTGPFALLAARSPNCTFEDRAFAAQALNASALIVYNSLEGIYRNRSFAEDKTDYECSNGRSWETVRATRYGGYTSSACARDSACDSGKCVLTGSTKATSSGTTEYEICCAWDLYMTMAGDYAISIPSAFVTMSDYDKLAKNTDLLTGRGPTAELFARPLPWMNISSVLLWALGVVTCAYASWRSADEERRKIARAAEAPKTPAAAVLGGDAPLLASDAVRPTASAAHRDDDDDDDEPPPALELTTGHAFGFIVVASTALLVLFFVDLYLTVNVLFAFSAASSTAQVVWRPLYAACHASRAQIFDSALTGSVSVLDVLSLATGVCTSTWWFTCRHASYAWALQDLFGVCLVILFLGVIRLSNIKVATLLLSMAFAYDIFFVFISPIFFEQSVMVKVATGDGPTADPDYCEKYPTDSDCTTTSLPMLLLLPRIADYTGGYTMLGLGDIVLPGLLVSFAIRYDVSIRRKVPWYFILMVIGYSIGLMMANVAVYVMDMGQPALLYLVPCTLGVFCAVSHREGTLQMMWRGPPSLNQGIKGGQEMYPCSQGDDDPGASGFHPTKDIESHRLLG